MVYRTTYKLEVGKKRALPLKGRKGTDEIKDLKIEDFYTSLLGDLDEIAITPPLRQYVGLHPSQVAFDCVLMIPDGSVIPRKDDKEITLEVRIGHQLDIRHSELQKVLYRYGFDDTMPDYWL
ncbi:MAG TPA: hypothetical protein HA282_04535 [Nanoarchaeota archaeon]|nr:hypothetical protein [Candidatus Pacearchaeota archaeon]HIH17761.1 hypothetical protein [Nanoarchaeota archaeon]HIH33786.1 hypothetical protein [Nanoarchaeota archaeon]HIH50802.1 hypothetical protein [Nanoarchaeota archaeon]HIH66452.1 hypothetical protein [Nanoarchaeota archaeon]